MSQRGKVTVSDTMPFIAILRQLSGVALERGREGGREGREEEGGTGC